MRKFEIYSKLETAIIPGAEEARKNQIEKLGVNIQGFVGVSYLGAALGQRVSQSFGIRTCDPCDSFLTIFSWLEKQL